MPKILSYNTTRGPSGFWRTDLFSNQNSIGRTAFSPTNLANLDYWFDFSDNSKVLTDGAAQFTSAQGTLLQSSSLNYQAGSGSITWAGWIYLDSKGADRPFFTRLQGAGHRDYELFYRNSTDRFQWQVSADGSSLTSTSATTFGSPSTSTWYFIVCGFDAVNGNIFVQVNNGTTNTTAFVGPIFNSVTTIQFGADTNSGSVYHNGRMDSWGFWRRTLTASEITSLYNAGAGRTYNSATTALPSLLTNIQAWIDFDELNGTRLDQVGGANLSPSGLLAIISITVLNGGFETAGAGGADVFANWTESTSGLSTLARDLVVFDTGIASCLMVIDASNSPVQISQTVLTAGTKYSYTLRAKSTSAGATILAGGNVASTQNTHTLTTSFATYTGTFIADSTTFLIKSGADTSLSINIDGVNLTAEGPGPAIGIVAGLASNNSPIKQVQDKSGNSNHATQTTLGLKPTYQTNVKNGLSIGRFDGTNDYLTTLALGPFAQPSTAYAIVKRTGTVYHQGIFDSTTLEGQILDFASSTAHGVDAGTPATATTNHDTSFHMVSVIFNGAASALYYDGTQFGGALSVGAGSMAGMVVGAWGDFTNPLNGDIGEILFYNALHTTVQRQQVEAYLRSKWGTP